jgi:hypothetical protein
MYNDAQVNITAEKIKKNKGKYSSIIKLNLKCKLTGQLFKQTIGY